MHMTHFRKKPNKTRNAITSACKFPAFPYSNPIYFPPSTKEASCMINANASMRSLLLLRGFQASSHRGILPIPTSKNGVSIASRAECKNQHKIEYVTQSKKTRKIAEGEFFMEKRDKSFWSYLMRKFYPRILKIAELRIEWFSKAKYILDNKWFGKLIVGGISKTNYVYLGPRRNRLNKNVFISFSYEFPLALCMFLLFYIFLSIEIPYLFQILKINENLFFCFWSDKYLRQFLCCALFFAALFFC